MIFLPFESGLGKSKSSASSSPTFDSVNYLKCGIAIDRYPATTAIGTMITQVVCAQTDRQRKEIYHDMGGNSHAIHWKSSVEF